MKGTRMRWSAALCCALAGGAACGGSAPGGRAVAESVAARGAPPENHDAIPGAADSNPSAARATAGAPSGVRVHPVNTGAHGMAAETRWLLSPDARALLVVEDAVGVEAEPVPDGFLFASERTGALLQVDGVWDVAPSPDWQRLAFGRAFVFRSGEADSIPEREWQRFLGWLPEDVADRSTAALRRRAEGHVFPVSGMSYAKGFALAQVVDVGALPRGRVAVVRGPTVRLEGWRVRWSPSGDTLAVGAAPPMVQDDAEPTRWTLVGTRNVRSDHDSLGGATGGLRYPRPAWTTGPTIDVSLPVDMTRARRLSTGGATVVSRAGDIVVERGGRTIAVGPGTALAATHDSQFIVALAPVADRKEYEPAVRLVVYELVP